MATKTFNSIDRSVDYVTYTPTANCNMAYNSGMNTSAQNEIALRYNNGCNSDKLMLSKTIVFGVY